MKRKHRNCGSAIIEMTLLTPILLGLFYFYITLFLFMIDSGKEMKRMVEVLYAKEDTFEGNDIDIGNNIMIEKGGNKQCVIVKDVVGPFDMELELCRYSDSAVKNIRRWQLVFDTIRTGEDE